MEYGRRGHGANHGFQSEGGGLVYVVSSPDEGGSIYPSGDGGFLNVTIGVRGSVILISTVQVFINSSLVFDGSVPGFTSRYAKLSSYSYIQPDNGYSFRIKEHPQFGPLNMTVMVRAGTPDGQVSEHRWPLLLYPAFPEPYPPVALGRSFGQVPVSAFTGEKSDGLLSSGAGVLFFTPSMNPSGSGGDVDFSSVQVSTDAQDRYSIPEASNARPFLVGPWRAVPEVRAWPQHWSPGHVSLLNDPSSKLVKTKSPDAVGTLYDTVSMVTTKILC